MKEFIEQFEPLSLKKDFAGVRLPKLKIAPKYYQEVGVSEKVSNAEFLQALCVKGFKDLLKRGKVNPAKRQEYAARTKEELDTFKKLNFTDYVLIVWDVIKFCKEREIPTGIGRGSVCGSLVFYLIGVTGIDSLEHDLFFQRFVSEARAKSEVIDGELYIDGSLMCDVDLDVAHSRREEVLEYLNKQYPNRIAKIINLNTLTGKALIKECGKAVGEKSEFEMNQVSHMVEKIFGDVQDIEKVYKGNKEFREWCDKNKDSYEIALKLRDLIKHKSVHASGIIISHDPLEETCPLELTSQGELVSGFDMKEITKFCIKLDILGLKTLTLIDEVCKLTGIKMEDINFNDPIIYTFLQDFKYGYGIFQLEAGTAEKVVRWIKPNGLEELASIMALARPGAMTFVKQYAESKKRGYPEKVHPIFDPIFEKTYGVPIYQEQLMKMSNAIGFSLDESEIIRRIVGKKDRDAVTAWESRIYKKVEEKGYPAALGKLLWDVLYKSKDYSFNKSHAIAYAALAAITAYLKIKYPKEFFFAALKIAKTEADRNEKILRISNEMAHFDIKLLPPSLKKSKEDFSLEEEGIRYGLSSIKGISEKALENLRKFDIDGFNKFQLFESAKQTKINIGVLSALIQAGAMGEFSESRSKMVLEAQLWSILLPKERAYCLKHGAEHNYDLIKMINNIMSWVGEDGKPLARKSKKTRLDTIKKNYEDYKKIYKQNSQYEDFANWWYERSLLGFSYSKSLKKIFKPACPHLMSIEEFNQIEGNHTRGIIVGFVNNIVEGVSRNKKRYTKFIIEDGTGQLTGLVFDDKDGPGLRTELKKSNKIPKKGQIAAFRGKKFEEIMIIDDSSPQDEKIYLKLADLKNDK